MSEVIREPGRATAGVAVTDHPAKRPRGRPRTLSREQVIAAALEMARDHGLEAMSMRQVARRLGIRETSLYTYVANKDDLLRGMLDEVFTRDLPLPDPDDPRPPAEQLKQVFRDLHQRALAHGELIGLLGRMPATTPAPLRAMDRIVTLLGRLGLTPIQQAVVYTLLHHVTVANALIAANQHAAAGAAAPLSLILAGPDQLRYPALAALIDVVGSADQHDGTFEVLLAFVVDELAPALAPAEQTR